jgi:hypothetical protein
MRERGQRKKYSKDDCSSEGWVVSVVCPYGRLIVAPGGRHSCQMYFAHVVCQLSIQRDSRQTGLFKQLQVCRTRIAFGVRIFVPAVF